MPDEEFCSLLEYRLSAFFANLQDEEARGFWCDGVLLSEPDSYYSIKYVNDHKQLLLTALTGKDGQTPYELVLLLGNIACSRYSRQLDISITVPGADNTERFYINTVERRIEIQLD